MKKAVAIQYIIALILGVVVVALLAYWFISTGGKGGNVGKDAECAARKTEYCAVQIPDKLNKISGTDGCDAKWTGCKVYEYCSVIIPNWQSTNPSIPNKCP